MAQEMTLDVPKVHNATADKFTDFVERLLEGYPYPVILTDSRGRVHHLGGNEVHWCGRPFIITFKTRASEKILMTMNPISLMEKFIEGEIDIEGNFYLLTSLAIQTNMQVVSLWRTLPSIFSSLAFQSVKRAKTSVKSHYDIPQSALDVYLDRAYRSYSCAMWEDPFNLTVEGLTRIGKGQEDDFDSLEKAQWRKFKDAADYLSPKSGETVLDVGCGYPGFLQVTMENYPDAAKVVGWTHSSNQVREGLKILQKDFIPSQYELNEGDYREDHRVYDCIHSTGMISHVGPRGLIPYVRNIRKRIRKGGRYVHHAIMTAYHPISMNRYAGTIVNRRYVWPGFHWFTIGQHTKALEKNGFYIHGLKALAHHYAKTTAAWNERMIAQEELMRKNLGEPTYRAWKLYLAGASGGIVFRGMQCYRVYCEAI